MSSFSASGRTAYIVDDEPDFGDFMGDVAENLGYEVTVSIRGNNFNECINR